MAMYYYLALCPHVVVKITYLINVVLGSPRTQPAWSAQTLIFTQIVNKWSPAFYASIIPICGVQHENSQLKIAQITILIPGAGELDCDEYTMWSVNSY